MKLWQSIHQSTQGRIVFAGILLYAVWQMYLGGSAPGKVAESLREGKGKVNVQVVLPFTPDRFHVIAMQQFGRVSGFFWSKRIVSHASQKKSSFV